MSRVCVAWPDGRPADDAWVYVAYPHTKDAVDFRRTDYAGNTELDVFGDSPIRVFAEIAVDDGTVRGATRFSVPVELETTKLPADFALVLSTSTLQAAPQP
ncbi:MAG TPA: hypothetical protein VMD78_04965 [Candidatus Baltobacteraceae bacterium]|nr:hypothetical protein [Candidatus Baltobacteraceae bacterium]